jgi:hypothetical protein
MNCNNCKKSIPDDSKFCTFCGFQIITDNISTSDSEITEIKDELKSLKSQLESIIKKPSKEKEQKQWTEVQTGLSKLQNISLNKPNIKVPGTGLFPTTNEIELLIGQNWLARIGSLAIIFGIGFFIKAAIDSNWISNFLIILIGAIFGFGFVLIGYLLNTKLSFYSRTLTGLGIGILYITTYSSFTTYDLFNIYIGSIIVFLISILGNFLAYYYKNISIGIISLIGAYSIPILAAISFETLDIQSITATGYYLPLVTLSSCIFLFNFRYQALFFGILIASCGSYLIWSGSITPNSMAPELQWAINAVIYLIILTGWWITNKKIINTYSMPSLLGLTILSLSFVLFSFNSLWDQYRNIIGIFGLIFGFLYLIPSVYSVLKSQKLTYQIYCIIAGFLIIFISIPVQFSSSWTTILWAMQAAIIIFVGFRQSIIQARILGYFILSLIIIKGLIWDFYNNEDMLPLINSRFLSLLSISVTSYFSYHIAKNLNLINYEKIYNNFLYFISIILLILTVNGEIYYIIKYFPELISNIYQMPLTLMLWIVTAGIISNLILRINVTKNIGTFKRYFGHSIILTFSVLTIIYAMFWNTENYIPFINIRTLTLLICGAGFYITILTIKKFSENLQNFEIINIKNSFKSFLFIIPFIILSLDLHILVRYPEINIDSNYYDPITSTIWGIIWAMTGTIYIFISIKVKDFTLRYIGLTAIGITIIKLFIFDLFLLPTTIRIFAFILLGIVLLVAGLNYQKNLDIMKKMLTK